MSKLSELDKLVMSFMIIELPEEAKRTPQFYNSIGTFLERHKFRLEALKTKGEGDDEVVDYTMEDLTDKDEEWLLAKLDAMSYHFMMEDLMDETKRKPTFYNSISKLLGRHEVSISMVVADSNSLGELSSALEDYDRQVAEAGGLLERKDSPQQFH